jgi:adenine deaminase
MPDTDIVVKGKRIAWVGPTGQWKGECGNIVDAKGLYAVPGFGESHKHIESSLLSPEWEAALVIPMGNTWTSEGSHEFSNVSGPHNVEFWLTPEKHGSPLKIFPALGSATPPSAFEVGGGNYAYHEIDENMKASLEVQGLDEVMDWPAVSVPTHLVTNESGKTSKRPATIAASSTAMVRVYATKTASMPSPPPV